MYACVRECVEWFWFEMGPFVHFVMQPREKIIEFCPHFTLIYATSPLTLLTRYTNYTLAYGTLIHDTVIDGTSRYLSSFTVK